MVIGVDWGTTAFRAYRMDAAGRVLERREEAERGILSVPPGGFPAVLAELVGPWLAAGETRVVMCGMVGSRQGWVEAPYVPCPATPAEIAARVVPVPFKGARAVLIPGLSTRDAAGVPDVMRGEETKLLGVMAALGDAAEALLCLPGTHSKWARLSAGRIAGFATQMTGESFAALSEHTILARTSVEGPTVPEAFGRGVRRSGEAGGLLHHLFGTRALGLMGELAATETRSYLSGLLIGHEIRAALAAPREAPAGSVHLLGSARLEALYADAFGILGVAHRRHDPDTVARGLALIGRTLG